MISIKNLRKGKPKHPYDVRVDRSSCLGNPFVLMNESQRDQVCSKYKAWLIEQGDNDRVVNEINRLLSIYKEYGKLNLFCWCTPKRCHAETIKEIIQFNINEEGD